MRGRRVLAGAAVFTAAMGMAAPVEAAPIEDEITGMAVTFDRTASEGGQTYCVYDVTVTLNHKGPVHVNMYAKDAGGATIAAENAEVWRRQASYSDELWVEAGSTVYFSADMWKHQGPNRSLLLDTYSVTGSFTCLAT